MATLEDGSSVIVEDADINFILKDNSKYASQNEDYSKCILKNVAKSPRNISDQTQPNDFGVESRDMPESSVRIYGSQDNNKNITEAYVKDRNAISDAVLDKTSATLNDHQEQPERESINRSPDIDKPSEKYTDKITKVDGGEKSRTVSNIPLKVGKLNIESPNGLLDTLRKIDISLGEENEESTVNDGEGLLQNTQSKPLLKCAKCDYTSHNKHYLKQHVELVHNAERLYKCPFCDYAGKRSHSLREHIVVHSSQRPYKCNFCNATFRRKGHLTNHVKMHGSQTTFYCLLCEEKFLKKKDLYQHLRRVHFSGPIYSCELCDYATAEQVGILEHVQIHGPPNTFKCNACSFLSLKADVMNNHVETDHSGETGYCVGSLVLLKCSECGFATDSRDILREHMWEHVIEPKLKAQGITTGNRKKVESQSEPARREILVSEKTNVLSTHRKPSAERESPLTSVSNTRPAYRHDDAGGVYSCAICGYICDHQRTIKAHIWKHSGHKDIDYPMFQNGPISIYDDTPVGMPFLVSDSSSVMHMQVTEKPTKMQDVKIVKITPVFEQNADGQMLQTDNPKTTVPKTVTLAVISKSSRKKSRPKTVGELLAEKEGLFENVDVDDTEKTKLSYANTEANCRRVPIETSVCADVCSRDVPYQKQSNTATFSSSPPGVILCNPVPATSFNKNVILQTTPQNTLPNMYTVIEKQLKPQSSNVKGDLVYTSAYSKKDESTPVAACYSMSFSDSDTTGGSNGRLNSYSGLIQSDKTRSETEQKDLVLQQSNGEQAKTREIPDIAVSFPVASLPADDKLDDELEICDPSVDSAVFSVPANEVEVEVDYDSFSSNDESTMDGLSRGRNEASESTARTDETDSSGVDEPCSVKRPAEDDGDYKNIAKKLCREEQHLNPAASTKNVLVEKVSQVYMLPTSVQDNRANSPSCRSPRPPSPPAADRVRSETEQKEKHCPARKPLVGTAVWNSESQQLYIVTKPVLKGTDRSNAKDDKEHPSGKIDGKVKTLQEDEAATLLSLLKKGPNLNAACLSTSSSDKTKNEKSSSLADDSKPKQSGICSSLLAVIEQLRERSQSENNESKPGTKKEKNQQCKIKTCARDRKVKKSSSDESHLSTEMLKNVEKLDDNEGTLRCTLCHYMNSCPSQMMSHMRLHKAKDPFECSLCSLVADSSENLQTHMLKHCKVRTYQCKLCDTIFNYKSQLRAHMRAHTEKKPLFCDTCSFVTLDLTAYQSHLRTHRKCPDDVCEECGHSGLPRQSKDDILSETDLKLVCKKCGFNGINMDSYRLHMRWHGKSSYKCTECGYVSGTMTNLKQHMRQHEEKELHCELCDFVATSNRSLKSHMKRHINDQRFVQQPLEQYKCTMCGYVCHHLPSLKSHMWRHASDKSYSYQDTNDRINAAIDIDLTSQESQIALEESSGSDGATDKEVTGSASLIAFRCCQCGFESADKTKLNSHMKTHLDIIEKTLEVNRSHFMTQVAAEELVVSQQSRNIKGEQ